MNTQNHASKKMRQVEVFFSSQWSWLERRVVENLDAPQRKNMRKK